MRIKNLSEAYTMGEHAKKQIEAALKKQVCSNVKRVNNVTELKNIINKNVGVNTSDIHIDENAVKKRSKPTRVIKDLTTCLNYCAWPSKDPGVTFHIMLEKRFGCYWRGGEIATEMIIPNGTKNWRMDWVHLPTRLIVEFDGFGFHRTKDAFKNDRFKQTHALVNGFAIHRITNEDVRKSPELLIPNIELMISHRKELPYHIKRKGKTQCVFVFPD
jgi:hypothetical protein